MLLNKTAHLDSRLELERVTSTIVTDSRDLCVSIPVQLLIEHSICGMMVTIEFHVTILSPGATVQLESESITVDEGVGSFNVCVVVNEANGCNVQFGFNVSFSASGTGMYDYNTYPATISTMSQFYSYSYNFLHLTLALNFV